MDLQTLLLAMSIPSGVTAFCFWLIEEKMKRERQEREQKEAIRQQSEILLIKSVMAAIALGEAAATALKNGHANGETEAALEYARKIKHEQKDFLTEQGIKIRFRPKILRNLPACRVKPNTIIPWKNLFCLWMNIVLFL